MKLWEKNSTKINKIVEKYTVGEDYLIDMQFILYDIQASKVHLEVLKKVNILSDTEVKKT